MKSDLRTRMEQAWQYIWSELFCPKTNLFYDYLTDADHEHRFDHLPTQEEVKHQFPNPGGWGTGMEDCMLTAGSVMDILRLRKELIGDTAATRLAEKVLDGIAVCATIHGRPGFLVRGVSPVDGTSCYFNSSRDQFTLGVYGAWRFLRSFADADDEFINRARTLLVNIASYCEQTISPKQDDLLRLDGRSALVSTMIHVSAHEALRLPMFYAAAWDVTRDPHWLELYRRYAQMGIEKTLRMNRSHPWWDIELAQMQVSLELLQSVEPESKVREQYKKAMLMAAELSDHYLRIELKKAREFSENWDAANTDWRCMPMVIRPETLASPQHSVFFGGYPYLMPCFPETYKKPQALLRGIGNLSLAELLCTEFPIAPDWPDIYAQITMCPDYSVHKSNGPVNVLHGYWVGCWRKLWK